MAERRDDDATVRSPARAASAPSTTPSPQDHVETEPIAGNADDEDTAALPPRFENRGTIGDGGMGRVLRVLDRSLNREVAVKILRRQHDPRSKLRFLREARAAGTLRHPNIVTVHDVSPEGDYLVMELVEGESLAGRLKREQRLDPDEVRRIGAELLDALDTAHREGIIHRDIKPANILLDASGTVKLTDFGIASFGDSELTSTGQLIGTPAYMAPEQLRGRRVDQRADVYGAGVTLFEAATGVRLNNKDEQVADPRRVLLETTGDEALAEAITGAVREKEAERHPSAAAFAEALASRAPVPRPRARPRWGLVALAVLATGAGVTAAVLVPGHHGGTPAAPHIRTVAMLPFEDHVGDPQLDFASSGLPHQLGDQLGRVESLHVIGYYRVRGRVEHPEDPASWLRAARALDADVVVRGVIEPVSGHVRVSAIVERTDGTVIDHVDREGSVDQVTSLVQALAPAVASAALGTPSELQPGPARGFDLERELQLGVAAFERQDFETARRHLDAAVTRDDSLAEAHYYLAILEWWRTGVAEPHITKALAGSLDPLEREFMTGLRLLVALDYPTALDYFQNLSRRAPDSRDVQYGLFEALYHGGHPGEAMDAYHHLRELAPGFYVGAEHAMMYYLARGDTEGISWTRAHWEVPAGEGPLWTARAQFAEQRHAEAVRTLESATEESGAAPVIARELVEAYAATGQLSLARDANARIVGDASFRALADYGLAVAAGEDPSGWQTRAHQAATLIPGLKPWETWLELVFLDLAAGTPDLLRKDLAERAIGGRILTVDLGTMIIARALHDTATVEAARTSTFPEVASLADAIAAETRHDLPAATTAWRHVIDRDPDGRFRLFAWSALAEDLHALGDQAGVIAACDEVIAPRVWAWAWAPVVAPCLRWSAEAATALGHSDDARRRWQRLLALRAAAPADDELARAARTALGR